MSAIRKVAPHCCMIGIDYSDAQLDLTNELGHTDYLLKMDAAHQEKVYHKIEKIRQGRLCDLVINCVTSENTERFYFSACGQGLIKHLSVLIR